METQAREAAKKAIIILLGVKGSGVSNFEYECIEDALKALYELCPELKEKDEEDL